MFSYIYIACTIKIPKLYTLDQQTYETRYQSLPSKLHLHDMVGSQVGHAMKYWK